MQEILLKAARKPDAPILLTMLRQMTKDLNKEHEFKGTLEALESAGFSENPVFESIIAWQGEQAVGFILYFYEFSTWTGRCGIYVQDLYVSSLVRGQGLAAKLVKQAIKQGQEEKNALYMLLAVHNDNHGALGFYEKMGFETVDGEIMLKLQGKAYTGSE